MNPHSFQLVSNIWQLIYKLFIMDTLILLLCTIPNYNYVINTNVLAQWVHHECTRYLCWLNRWMSSLHYLSKNLKQAAYCLLWDQRDQRVSSSVLPLSCCYSFSFSISLFPTIPELGELELREKNVVGS